MDIISFAVGVVATIIAYRIFDDSGILDFAYSNAVGTFALLFLVFCSGIFTLYPPKIGLFFDPVSSSYDPLV